MNCSTPRLNSTEEMNFPLELNISFIMDYAQLTPVESIFTLFSNPIYDQFEPPIQQIDSTGLLHIQVYLHHCLIASLGSLLIFFQGF